MAILRSPWAMSEMENMERKEGEKFDENCWVVQVESALENDARPDESHDGLIHTIPKSLLTKNPEFYHPQVISFGPYHFQIKDPQKNDMELRKSEVATKMHRKIKGGLKLVMEKFKKRESQQRIKESYAKNFELSSEVCAWMMVRDTCFVLEVLDRFRKDEDQEKSGKASMDSTLSRKRHHPLLTEIVKDMLKMENQLPFWALEEIRSDIPESNDDVCSESPVISNEDVWFESSPTLDDDVWFESALKNLSPIEVAKGQYGKYNKKFHILQLLHDYIVDEQVDASSNIPSGRPWIPMIEILQSIRPEICIKCLFRLLYAIILLLLSPVVVIFAIWYYIKNYNSPKKEKIGKHIPTVEELKRVGVKFKKLKDDKTGISHIKFEESDSTLFLPKFKVDNRSEVILRNLIALEICSQDEKPITRYAILMNDLINTSGDVGILRREDIITSTLGSDDEIAQLWNSLVTSTEMPGYNPIDNASSSINLYRKKWWKVLWAQFIMVHCSKPWLFLSLLAGLILLGLTLIQVFCLFESCLLK